jgi:hypothetical protein
MASSTGFVRKPLAATAGGAGLSRSRCDRGGVGRAERRVQSLTPRVLAIEEIHQFSRIFCNICSI